MRRCRVLPSVTAVQIFKILQVETFGITIGLAIISSTYLRKMVNKKSSGTVSIGIFTNIAFLFNLAPEIRCGRLRRRSPPHPDDSRGGVDLLPLMEESDPASK